MADPEVSSTLASVVKVGAGLGAGLGAFFFGKPWMDKRKASGPAIAIHLQLAELKNILLGNVEEVGKLGDAVRPLAIDVAVIKETMATKEDVRAMIRESLLDHYARDHQRRAA